MHSDKAVTCPRASTVILGILIVAPLDPVTSAEGPYVPLVTPELSWLISKPFKLK